MKKLMIIVTLVLASLMVLPAMSMAAPSRLLFPEKPTNVQFTNENWIMIELADVPNPLLILYKGGGFPKDTQARIHEVVVTQEKSYTIEYQVPGGTWTEVTWDMLANEPRRTNSMTNTPATEARGGDLPEGTEVRIRNGRVQIKEPGGDWQDYGNGNTMEIYRSPVYDPITHKVIAYDIFIYNRETGETIVLYSNVDTKWYTVRVLGITAGTAVVAGMLIFWVL